MSGDREWMREQLHCRAIPCDESSTCTVPFIYCHRHGMLCLDIHLVRRGLLFKIWLKFSVIFNLKTQTMKKPCCHHNVSDMYHHHRRQSLERIYLKVSNIKHCPHSLHNWWETYLSASEMKWRLSAVLKKQSLGLATLPGTCVTGWSLTNTSPTLRSSINKTSHQWVQPLRNLSNLWLAQNPWPECCSSHEKYDMLWSLSDSCYVVPAMLFKSAAFLCSDISKV